MSAERGKVLRFGVAIIIIVLSLGYLAYTGIEESKSYYHTVAEIQSMDQNVFEKRLRVAGHVEPGSIKRSGSRVEFILNEEGKKLNVIYTGTEVPPDTFVDSSQALVEGTYGRDGVFHAKKLQAKCASKYEAQDKQSQAADNVDKALPVHSGSTAKSPSSYGNSSK
jgi:cytochrome c-type biogenesis protein CcmE